MEIRKDTHLKGELKPFHYRGDTKMVGKEDTLKTCTNCKKELLPKFFSKKGTLNANGASYLQIICRPCANALDRENTQIKKIAPPKPFFCECCFVTTDQLQRDHIHGTFTFRGWICKSCNTGLGMLRDNLRGVLAGAFYLEKDPKKIIEEINQIVKEKETDG